VTLTNLVQGLIDSGNPELQPEHTLARVAMRRYGKPEEMAATVAFLLGPDSAYMTVRADDLVTEDSLRAFARRVKRL
jgi:NAD(P)-dependent dehydrogenase (short-subunit alcohol dehydrogenase family)